jgi:tetrahydromethanopterin S-methyltransferase subunit G
MNNQKIAQELVTVAKGLVSADNTDAYEKLLKYVKGGTAILTAGEIHKDIPTIHNFAKKYHNSVEHMGYGLFRGRTGHGEFNFDAGGAMNRDGGVSWTTLSADKSVLRDLKYNMVKVKRALQELLSGRTAKELVGAFVDQPVPFGADVEDEMEKVRTEAEEKLGKQLELVKGRYYWQPGRSIMVNMTLTGRPLFQEYRMGGMFGVGYRKGVLTVNPQWISSKDSIPSYKWGYVVDKLIKIVKQSEKIEKKIDAVLDKVEQKTGKIDSDIRRDIIKWCVKAAKRRLSVRAYPGPKGKEFVIHPEEQL